MDTDTFDRLTRSFGRSGTRRAALAALLGSAVMATALGIDAVEAKPKRQGKRRRKRAGKNRGGISAQAKTKADNQCISPSTGVDLNAFFDVAVQIVTGFCQEVGAGEKWTVGQPWFMAQDFDVVPTGFEPAGTTPLADFIAKFEAVKYVIDPGTSQAKTVVFPNDDSLFVAPDFNGRVLVSPMTLGTLQPLSVGRHVVDVYWIFSAMHCDGIGANTTPGPTANCLPAGETWFVRGLAFSIKPGHYESEDSGHD